jgi:hypothetical protein
MKPSELPGARRLYRLTNRALAQIRELWQYAGEDELPPDSLLQAQVEAFRILRIDVPLSAKRQFQLFCSEHFPGLADILDCLAADQLWALLSMSRCASSSPSNTSFYSDLPPPSQGNTLVRSATKQGSRNAALIHLH